ncbi:MAG TPA: Tat pathway signal protein, partial [Brevundimonas sp.]|nr:Tat pathway signal protein [Brevundimonas sp.]
MDRRALLGLKTQPLRTGGGGAAASQATYLRLPTITANVRRPGGRPGVMTVETGVDTPDAALRTRVAQ